LLHLLIPKAWRDVESIGGANSGAKDSKVGLEQVVAKIAASDQQQPATEREQVLAMNAAL
jgi:hypothetical protein